MNRRLYFILPDVEVSRLVLRDLLLARVSENHMHFLGKRGMDLEDLPEATSAERSDITHGMQVGIVSGALGGAIIGLGVYGMQVISGMKPMYEIILLLFILGAAFGVWVSGVLIGSSTPNTKLKQFEHAIDEGHILLMLDVPKDKVDEVRELILKHHPEAEDHGIEPTIPAFP